MLTADPPRIVGRESSNADKGGEYELEFTAAAHTRRRHRLT
jgi:hypothetical protein